MDPTRHARPPPSHLRVNRRFASDCRERRWLGDQLRPSPPPDPGSDASAPSLRYSESGRLSAGPPSWTVPGSRGQEWKASATGGKAACAVGSVMLGSEVDMNEGDAPSMFGTNRRFHESSPVALA